MRERGREREVRGWGEWEVGERRPFHVGILVGWLVDASLELTNMRVACRTVYI